MSHVYGVLKCPLAEFKMWFLTQEVNDMAVVWMMAIYMALHYPVYINYTKLHQINQLLRVCQNSISSCVLWCRPVHWTYDTILNLKKKNNTFCAQGVSYYNGNQFPQMEPCSAVLFHPNCMRGHLLQQWETPYTLLKYSWIRTYGNQFICSLLNP